MTRSSFPFHEGVKHSKIDHKLEHLKKVASQCDEKSEDYYTDIARLFGEDTYHFKTLEELRLFLGNHKKQYDIETNEALVLIERMVPLYETWKITTDFNNVVKLRDVRVRLALQNTLPQGQITQITDFVSVNEGFDQTREIVKDVARDMLEELQHDQEAEKRKKEYVMLFLKLIFNVINAGIAVEIVHTVLAQSLDASTNNLLVSVLATETVRETTYISADSMQKLAKRIIGKQLSHKHIDNLIDVLWKLSIAFINKNIDFSKEVDQTLTDDKLTCYMAEVQKEQLLPALRTHHYPHRFDYTAFVAEKIATKIKETNQQLLQALQNSLTEGEVEAKIITTLEGEGHRLALKNCMIRHYHGGTLCRDYFNHHEKFRYVEMDAKSQLRGFDLMQRKADRSVKYFPTGVNPDALMLTQPKPGKGSMHIGGKHSRAYVYAQLSDLEDPVYGYKGKGKYDNKNRIKDTWRADHVIQLLLMTCKKLPNHPHSVLPFPTFKSASELGDAVVEVLKINPLFRSGNYSYQRGKLPHPTPLYLITHMKDYQYLLEKPGVTAYIRKTMSPCLILQSVTDPNIKSLDDYPRMMQALDDSFFFLEHIGYQNDLLKMLRVQCQGYIYLQCMQQKNRDCIELFKNIIVTRMNCNHLDESLEKHEIEINKLIVLYESLHQDDDRIKIIEAIIVNYLSDDFYDSETQKKLQAIMSELFSRKTLEMTEDKRALLHHLNHHALHRSHSHEVFHAVKKHNQAKSSVRTLVELQNLSVQGLATVGTFAPKANDSKMEESSPRRMKTL